jgi:hypothetical protein
MPDHEDEARMAPAEGGGRTQRGPQVDSGGEQEPGGLVPPYEGRVTEGGGSNPWQGKGNDQDVEPGPGRVVSDVEREGVPATDMNAETPLGVGESLNRGGEEYAARKSEPGREDQGTKGASDRSVGTSDERDSTAFEQDTVTDTPHQPTGDQGG